MKVVIAANNFVQAMCMQWKVCYLLKSSQVRIKIGLSAIWGLFIFQTLLSTLLQYEELIVEDTEYIEILVHFA